MSDYKDLRRAADAVYGLRDRWRRPDLKAHFDTLGLWPPVARLVEWGKDAFLGKAIGLSRQECRRKGATGQMFFHLTELDEDGNVVDYFGKGDDVTIEEAAQYIDFCARQAGEAVSVWQEAFEFGSRKYGRRAVSRLLKYGPPPPRAEAV
jgi:hypothetical protein